MKLFKNKYLYKIFAVLIAVQIVFVGVYGMLDAQSAGGQYETEAIYTFGDGSKNSFSTQGQQGFYAMYSTSVNQGKTAFPVATAKECVLDSDNYWKIPKDGGGFESYFRIGSGKLSGVFAQVNELATGFSSVIKWVAPMDGEFSVSAAWRGDSGGILSANNDGINLGIYKNSENIYNYQITEIKGYAAGPSWNNGGNKVTLNKGDALYFVADPKETGYADQWHKDSPWVKITITGKVTLAENTVLPEADANQTPAPGEVYFWGDWTKNTFEKQGQQGFYAMYSSEVGQGDSFPIDKIYLLERDTDNASPYYKIPLSDGSLLTSNKFFIGSGVDYNGNPTTSQSAVSLDNGYSAVLRWVAPADGDYALNVNWKADNNTGIFTANNDGVGLSVYLNNNRLYYHDQTEKIAGWGACPSFANNGNVISMKKGDSIYVIADPKAVGWSNSWTLDTPWVNISVEYRDSLKQNNILPEADMNKNPTAGTVYAWGDWTKNTFQKQGQQGFYAMYSQEVDKGSTFPVETAYLLEKDSEVSSPYYKIPYESGGFLDGFLMGTGINSDGTPTDHQAAMDLKTGFSGVLRWVAPADGDYLITAQWVYSLNGVYTNSDGLIVGVYRGNENLFNHEQINKITQWGKNTEDKIPSWNNDGKTVSLRKGESIYIIGDPKQDGTNDRPWVSVTIEYRCEISEDRELPAADTNANPEVGESYFWGDWTKNTFVKQGQEGFYAMFSTAVNKGESFPVETAALLKRNTDEALPYWMVPLQNGGFDSDFLIGAGTDYTGNATNRQSAVILKNGYSSILRWVAPADGYYHVRAAWKCHDETGVFSGTKDGLSLSVYKESEMVYYKDIEGVLKGWDKSYPKWNNNGDTVEMKKGQSLYFISDPKGEGAGDTPWITLDITYEGDEMIYAAKRRAEDDFSWTPKKELEIGTEFWFGDVSRNTFLEEGQEGFFAMYGTAVAQGDKYPVNTLKKCVFNDFTNFWTIPEDSADYDAKLRIASGRTDMHPSIFVANGKSAALKWVAPVDGTYTVKWVSFGNWNAKPKFGVSGSDDGLTKGIYLDDGTNLYTHTYENGEIIVFNDVVYTPSAWVTCEVKLKKGEAVYFVNDPNKDITGDNPWGQVNIVLKNMKVTNHNAVEDDWTPEVREVYYYGDECYNMFEKQGEQNFYTMYLTSSNYTNDFPTFGLKRMESLSVTNSYRQWMTGSNLAQWMYARATGLSALQDGKSMGIKWLAPEDGTYYVDAYIFQGTKQGYRENSGEDGIAYGLYHGSENLTYMDKDATSWISSVEAKDDPEQHMKATVTMKKGEALYLTADSKKLVAGSDMPGIRIKISTTPEKEIDFTTGMRPFDVKSGTNKNTTLEKNSILPIIIIVASVILLAAVGTTAFIIIKKKKAD